MALYNHLPFSEGGTNNLLLSTEYSKDYRILYSGDYTMLDSKGGGILHM